MKINLMNAESRDNLFHWMLLDVVVIFLEHVARVLEADFSQAFLRLSSGSMRTKKVFAKFSLSEALGAIRTVCFVCLGCVRKSLISS